MFDCQGDEAFNVPLSNSELQMVEPGAQALISVPEGATAQATSVAQS
jgi:hypothetical protein